MVWAGVIAQLKMTAFQHVRKVSGFTRGPNGARNGGRLCGRGEYSLRHPLLRRLLLLEISSLLGRERTQAGAVLCQPVAVCGEAATGVHAAYRTVREAPLCDDNASCRCCLLFGSSRS